MDFSISYTFILLIIVLNQHHFQLGDINALANIMIKRRIDDYLKYCPFTNTCDTRAYELNDTILSMRSCCKYCNCDSRCGLDCCPDRSVQLESEEDIYNAKELNRCIDAQFRPVDLGIMNGKSFKMISRCPYKYDDNELATKCAREYSELALDVPLRYILPAYSNFTDLIYKNIYCAKCHNVPESNLEFAGISFTCLTEKRHITYVRELEAAAHSKNEDDCNILFKFPDAEQQNFHWYSKTCDRTLISRCNVTGLWKTYDSYLEKACLSYKSVYENFRNVHCFLCNGLNESEIRNSCNNSMAERESFSFISTLDWSIDSQTVALETAKLEPTKKDVNCLQNGLMDLSKADDWYLHCPDGMVLGRDTCAVAYFSIQSYVVMEVNLVIEPKYIQEKESVYKLHQLLLIAINEIEKKVSLLISRDLQLYNIKGFVKFKTDINIMRKNPLIFRRRSVQYVALKIQILVNRLKFDSFETLLDFVLVFTNMSDFGDFIAKFHHFDHNHLAEGWLSHSNTCTTDLGQPKYLICVPSPNHSSREVKFLISNTELETPLNIHYVIVRVEPEPFCPRIALPKQRLCNESEHIENIYSDTFLHKILSENETHMFFCYQDYFQHLYSLQLQIKKVKNKTLPLERGAIQKYLSITCLSASLLSLILSLVVYSVYPVLRSLPGLNNMALVTSLILFQTFTLVNTISTTNIIWLCAFIGAFTHFSLILSFAWMFVCTFHMLKVFVKIRNRSVGRNDTRTFATYLAFTIIVAIVTCIITATVAMVQSGGKDIGYGGHICYIKNPVMIIVAVAVPVAIVTFLNIVMFGIVVFRVNKVPILASSNPQERNNITIFAKLSTITGMAWVFGFIYIFSKLDAFAYIFEVLNAGQGVFIMLSFISNRRVLNLVFKKKMLGTLTKQTTTTKL